MKFDTKSVCLILVLVTGSLDAYVTANLRKNVASLVIRQRRQVPVSPAAPDPAVTTGVPTSQTNTQRNVLVNAASNIAGNLQGFVGGGDGRMMGGSSPSEGGSSSQMDPFSYLRDTIHRGASMAAKPFITVTDAFRQGLRTGLMVLSNPFRTEGPERDRNESRPLPTAYQTSANPGSPLIALFERRIEDPQVLNERRRQEEERQEQTRLKDFHFVG
ncbi:unnamed protein product [Cyprideis torosa]|uniref:Uncharacterized protein n=1 Tax=Cyprideis torosa TaxID=163714 RepID=A0A7R8ZP59_9CRUS|nr:unnamed protein product [Cyprideis torosa]CAG0889119.1 unnamed protein product [Cyprideis torosa]